MIFLASLSLSTKKQLWNFPTQDNFPIRAVFVKAA